MLQEALEFLAQQAKDGAAVQEVYQDSRRQIRLVEGEQCEFDKEVPDRRHVVTTLDCFARATKAFGDSDATIWVGLTGVVCSLNGDRYRGDQVSINIPISHLFDAVAELPNVRAVENSPAKGLIKYVQTRLYPSVLDPENFLEALREIKMETTDQVGATHVSGNDQISRSVAAKVSGSSKIPEELKISFEAFPSLKGELDCKVSVDCRVYVDATARTITVVPLPGSIEEAKLTALRALAKKINEKLPELQPRTFCGIK